MIPSSDSISTIPTLHSSLSLKFECTTVRICGAFLTPAGIATSDVTVMIGQVPVSFNVRA